MGKKLRLDKYLADIGLGTRSEIKSWIRRRQVNVNGDICIKPETKVDITEDIVIFDGNRLEYHEYTYLMLHKPAGVVSATIDNVSRTVLDLVDVPNKKDLFPVGRLDKDTEGLLLLTNDGDLAHRLLAPGKHVDKVYYAKVNGIVTDKDVADFYIGVPIEKDYITRPAKLTILSSDTVSEILLTLHEGKFHQVKRMFEAVGKEVIYLKRISMGGLILDPTLTPGKYRKLTEDEIANLKNL